MITVVQAPPYLTVQDLGRAATRSSGVPRGGAMDRFALQALNAIVGNSFGDAALEWALGGGALRFDSPADIAFGGARVRATLSGEIVQPFTTLRVERGAEFRVEEFTRGRFVYVAFRGGIDVPEVLASRSTYLTGSFGGYRGRRVTRGDVISLGDRAVSASSLRAVDIRLPSYDAPFIRVTRGIHAELFDSSVWQNFSAEEFTVGMASDRTGYKLTGPLLAHSLGSLPSDPGCEGVVQIPSDGAPIVLMADAPTVGGYPKIAVVSEVDLPLLAQRNPGEKVRFRVITIEESQRALRQRALELDLIRSTGAAPA